MSAVEPQAREEVEAFLRVKLNSGDAEAGLYALGLGHVVVDRVGSMPFRVELDNITGSGVSARPLVVSRVAAGWLANA